MPRISRRIGKRRSSTRKSTLSRRKRRTVRRTRRSYGMRRVGRKRVGGVKRRRYIRGKGAYSFSNSRISQQIPQFGQGGEGVTYLSNREQVGEIFLEKGYNGKFCVAKLDRNGKVSDALFRLNAGSTQLFPWGAGICGKYEMYKFTGLVFTFEPLINTQNSTMTSIPEIVMSSNDNPYVGAPTSAEGMKIQPLSAFSRVDRTCTAGVECHQNKVGAAGWKYIVQMNDYGHLRGKTNWASNRQETDFGQFAIAISGGAPQSLWTNAPMTLGRLYVSYRIQLMRPISQDQVLGEVQPTIIATDAWVAGFVSKTDANGNTTTNGPGEQSKGPSTADRHAVNLEYNQIKNQDNNNITNQTDVQHANNEGHNNNIGKTWSHFHDYNPGRLTETNTYETEYGWDQEHTTTGGFCAGIFKYTCTDALSSTDSPAENECIFENGCLVPKVTNPIVQAGNSSIKCYESMIDSIGLRLCRQVGDNTRLYFLRRPRPGAVFKITVSWKGMIHVANGAVPSSGQNLNNKLWVHAYRPATYATTALRYFTECPEALEAPDCDTANGIQRSEFRTYIINRGYHFGLSNDWNGPTPSNTLSMTGTKANAHNTFPLAITSDSFTWNSYFVYTGQEDDLLPYIELGRLLAFGVRVFSSMQGNNTNPRFVKAWPANTGSVPTYENGTAAMATTQADPVRYGARSIEVREVTYHELPRHYQSSEMMQRKQMYSMDDFNEIANNAQYPQRITNTSTSMVYVAK